MDHHGSVSISWRRPVDLYCQSKNDTVTVTDWAEPTGWLRCHRCHGIGTEWYPTSDERDAELEVTQAILAERVAELEVTETALERAQGQEEKRVAD